VSLYQAFITFGAASWVFFGVMIFIDKDPPNKATKLFSLLGLFLLAAHMIIIAI